MSDERDDNRVLRLAARLGLAVNAAAASDLPPRVLEALRLLAAAIPVDPTDEELRQTVALSLDVHARAQVAEAPTATVLPQTPSLPSDTPTLSTHGAPLAPLPPARLFGRYEILGEVGRGGMGIVYRARQPGLDRVVALKVMIAREHAKEEALDRFLREARATARLDHPNIVQVYDVGEEGALHFFTMRFVEGPPLSESRGAQALSPREGATLVRKVALALEYAHAHGVIHRDVKPGNILIDANGEPCLVDFGLAKDLSANGLTTFGSALGTPSFASPEQAGGDTERSGPLTDVYSLGATLYHVLAGRPPFIGENALVVLRHVIFDDPEPLRRWRAEIPVELEAICLMAMEKKPAHRYPSAGDLARDLERFLAGEPVRARPISAVERVWRRARRHSGALVAACLGTLLVISAAAWAWTSHQRAGERESVASSMDEALRLAERAREALDLAERLVYDPEATWDELDRRARTALSLAERSATAVPRLPQPHVLAGRANELLGDSGKAEALYREATRLDATYGPARFRLGRLLMERADSIRLTTASSAHARMHQEVGRLSKEAATELAAASEGAGFEDPLPRLVCDAICAFALESREEALRQARAGLNRFQAVSGAEEFYVIEASCTTGAERRHALDEAIRRAPFHSMARWARATTRVQEGDHRGALLDLDAALKLRPGFVYALVNRGVVRHATGDFAGAGTDYEEALRLHPGWPGAHVGRGLLREQFQDPLGPNESTCWPSLPTPSARPPSRRGRHCAGREETGTARSATLTRRFAATRAWAPHSRIAAPSGMPGGISPGRSRTSRTTSRETPDPLGP